MLCHSSQWYKTASPTVPSRRLPAGRDVHVWCCALRRIGPPMVVLASVLSEEERRRAEAYRFAADRRRFTVGRALLRWLVACYTGRPARALRLVAGPYGKPMLADGGGHALRFSLSATRGLAVVALAAGRDVGVDVEGLRPLPDALTLARTAFTSREAAALDRLPDSDRATAFLRAWTRKEAVVKAIGAGLSFGLDRVEVTMTPAPRLRAIEGRSRDAAGWSLVDLGLPRGTLGALAVAGPTPVVTVRTTDIDTLARHLARAPAATPRLTVNPDLP